MADRKPLGEILLESGRITQADVERVLEHQRAHGGYFGQALVELGILTRDEIDWALASQFDLPFIFPDPQNVDREAALLVPADWALAHLAVPMVKAGGTLTVVVADPLRGQALDELRKQTGLDVEMALASGSRIRELIRAIYGDPGPIAPSSDPALHLSDVLTRALDAGAERFGISARAAGATAWYVVQNTRQRRALLEGWETLLEDVLDPSPFEPSEGARTFDATLATGRADIAVSVQVLAGRGGTEILIIPQRAPAAALASTLALPPAIAAELRLLARSGSARVAVHSPEPALARTVVPHLPALAFQESVHSVHVTREPAELGVYTLHAEDAASVAGALDAFGFDALSTDLPLDVSLAQLLRAASIAFALADSDDPAALRAVGINWLLHVARDRDAMSWELRATSR